MDAFEDLVDKLKNGSQAARYTAANKLGKSGHGKAVDHLLLALSDTDEMVLDNVIFALGELGDLRAAAPLVKVLRNNPSGRARKSAAKSLGMLRAAEAVDALAAALSDSDFKVRKSAARSLGQIGDKKAIPKLKAALQDENFTVVKYVEDALDRMGSL